MSIIDTIKSRPLLFGGVVVGGIVLLVALRATSGGGSMEAGVPYQGDVGMGDALQQAQLAIQGQLGLAQIAAQSQADTTAAQLEAARLEYEYRNNAAEIGENISLANINATLQSLTTQNTLNAQVEMNRETAETNRIALSTQAAVQSQQILANVYGRQIDANAQAAHDAMSANIVAIQAASQSRRCGFLGLSRC